jgi:hypothetical protein
MYTPKTRIERPEASTKPTVDQMFALQRIGVKNAKAQKKLRPSQSYERTSLFVPQEVDGYILGEGSSNPRYWTHRFTGRIAQKGFNRKGFQEWSMVLAELFWVQDDTTGHNRGVRTSYKFAWNKDEVNEAHYHAHVAMPNVISDDAESEAELRAAPAGVMIPNGEKNITSVERSIGAVSIEEKSLGLMPIDQLPSSMKETVARIESLSYGDVCQLTESVERFGLFSNAMYYRAVGVSTAGFMPRTPLGSTEEAFLFEYTAP